jgi:hypothetical protein
MDREPLDAVERMFVVSSTECCNIFRILASLFG